MDMKKEIRLSDLVPKRKPKSRPKASSPAPRKRRRQAQLVGLKVGSSQLAAALVTNNGGVTLSKLVREPLEDGIVAAGAVHDRGALAKALDALARRLADGPAFAYSATKVLLSRELDMDLGSAIELEAMTQALLMKSDDFGEFYAAWSEGRTPAWTGR